MNDAVIRHIVDAITINGFWTEGCGPGLGRVEMKREQNRIKDAVRRSGYGSETKLIFQAIRMPRDAGFEFEEAILDLDHPTFKSASSFPEAKDIVIRHVADQHPDDGRPLGCFGIYTGRPLPNLRQRHGV